MLLGLRQASKGKARQGSVPRGECLSVSGDVAPERGTVTGNSSIHQTPKESSQALLTGIRCCILLSPESTLDIPPSPDQPLGGPGEAFGEKQEKREPRLGLELGVEAGGPAQAVLSLSQRWCCARAARGQGSGTSSTGHRLLRHRVISLGIAGAKQAGGRFAFSRRVGVL